MPIINIKDKSGNPLYTAPTERLTVVDVFALEIMAKFLKENTTHAKSYRKTIIEYCYDFAQEIVEEREKRGIK